MMCKNLGHWFFQMLLKSMAITKQKWDAWYWTRSRSPYRIYLFMALKFPCSLKISSLGYIEKKKKGKEEREKNLTLLNAKATVSKTMQRHEDFLLQLRRLQDSHLFISQPLMKSLFMLFKVHEQRHQLLGFPVCFSPRMNHC